VLGGGPELEKLLLDGDLPAALSGLGRYLVLFGDPTSFLLILLGIIGYALLFGPKEFARGGQAFGAFSYPQDEESAKTGRFFQGLAVFTAHWGGIITILGLVLMMANLDPDTMGPAVAIALLGFFYASGLAVFVFLPIGLRLFPWEKQLSFGKLAVSLSLTGIGIIFLLGFILAVANLGDGFPRLHITQIFLFIDIPSLVLIVGSWWIFRMAAGKRGKLLAVPVIILIGIFWSIQGLALLLCNLDPDTLGPGIAVSVITLLYASIAAAGFLIGDMRRSFQDPPPVPPAEDGEQAKEIIDRVVEQERR
jgi:hypothetical protein